MSNERPSLLADPPYVDLYLKRTYLYLKYYVVRSDPLTVALRVIISARRRYREDTLKPQLSFPLTYLPHTKYSELGRNWALKLNCGGVL